MNEGPPDPNPAHPDTIRVQFNNGKPWDMPTSWAVTMLQNIAKKHRDLFRREIDEAMNGGAK